MKLIGKWVMAVAVAAAAGYLAGLVTGSGVAAISIFFCLLMLAWAAIYRPWEQ